MAKEVFDETVRGLLSKEELAVLDEPDDEQGAAATKEEADAAEVDAGAEAEPVVAGDGEDPKAEADPETGEGAVAEEAEALRASSNEFRWTISEQAKGEIKELTEKFEAGEMTTAEWAEQRDAVRDADRDVQLGQFYWDRDCAQFLSEHAEYKDKRRFTMFNALVMEVANDPKNAENARDGRWVLREAQKAMQEVLGAPADPGVKKEAAAAIAKAKANAEGRRVDPSRAPRTLARMPAAAAEAAGEQEGEFAELEKLKGMEMERAVARMTPEQRRRYEES